MHNYFTNYHTITFCIVTNKFTIISQIITPLHFVLWPTNAQLFHKLLHHYILYCDQQTTIISQIITPLHFVLWPTNAQLFHKLSHHYILHYDQQMHNCFKNYHTSTCFGTKIIKIKQIKPKFCNQLNNREIAEANQITVLLIKPTRCTPGVQSCAAPCRGCFSKKKKRQLQTYRL